MLRELFKQINFMKVMPCREWYPSLDDRDFWEYVAKEFGEKLGQLKQEIDVIPKQNLTASMYLEFSKNGNRTNYQNVFNIRREELVVKGLLECCYNDGRYLEDIINLVWMILEETTWTYPAHNKYVETADGLPDYEQHSLDLGVIRTADILAFIYQVLGEKMDVVSKVIKRRIQSVIKKVVFHDFLVRDDYWWMGFQGADRALNNINPWTSSYVLRCAHILEDDIHTFRKLVFKVACVMDNWLEQYPEDGACNEGPIYWGHSVGCAIEGMEALNLATDNGFEVALKNTKFKNMGKVLKNYHMYENVYTNFGDAASTMKFDAWSYYHYGKLLGSDKMCDFAVDRYQEMADKKEILCRGDDILREPVRMLNIFRYDSELKKSNPVKDNDTDTYCYYPSMHFLVAKPTAQNKMFLAFKGGHNKQSHNHNDVGSFMVCKNGVRYLIDVGYMTYTKATFSADRYTIWTNRSEYHNLPIINGHGQKDGIVYAATDVEFSQTDTVVTLSMNLKETYENRNEINRWIRKIDYELTRNEITVTEDFGFAQQLDYELCFMTPQRAEFADKVLTLKATNGEKLELIFENVNLDFELEEVQIEDPVLCKNWGKCLYRIHLKARAKAKCILYHIK